MGDLGYIDEKGRIWFCGRKSHRVTTAEGELYTIPVESIFNEHPLVARTALVGIGTKGNELPIVCVELIKKLKGRSKGDIIVELRELGAKFGHTKGLKHFLFHPSFPVDTRHNSKINREQLAVWAEKRI
jgi:acyl-coenzyme A synthetase/AMP-(fatty) acid ligase